MVATAAYRALSGAAPERPFLRYALLCEAAGERDEAGGAVLQAAWTFDDRSDDRAAAGLRRRAAGLWGEGTTMQEALLVIDVLRRAGERVGAQAQVDRVAGRAELEETDGAIVAYQRGLIAAGDLRAHLMSSALRPPARTPHVTHGRMAVRGFWQRLSGR